MKYAYFPGCKIPYYVPQYGAATKAVFKALDIQLADVEFNCCGYPVRHLSQHTYVLSSARNLALAEREGCGIITPCKCCFGSLKKAEYLLKESKELKEDVNRILSRDGLKYEGTFETKHILSTLYHEVGTKELKSRVVKPFTKLNIATHYGCHALRPSAVTQFDDPMDPKIFDQLVEVTGAKSVPWALKLECCGNPLWNKNETLARSLTRRKLEDGMNAGADYLCVSCTYCQIQFDTVQSDMLSASGNGARSLPSLLYPQLLGVSMGLDEKALGIHQNILQGPGVLNFVAPPPPTEES